MFDNFESLNWIEKQWETANFGDKRLNNRIVQLAGKMIENPNASLPKQVGNWSDLKGAYRLLNNPKLNIHNIQEPHCNTVLNKAKELSNPVLFIQDTSEIDYTNRLHAKDYLGPIGNHRQAGIMVHSCLAVETGKVPNILGLASQIPWIRPYKASYKKTETRAQRRKRETEALYWQKTLEKIGIPPKNKQWISVGDRGNDIFSFLDYCFKYDWYFLIRTNQNRCIVKTDNQKLDLKSYVRSLKSKGERSFYLRGRNGVPARTVGMNVTWIKTVIDIPKSSYVKTPLKPINVTLIRCWEDKPDGLGSVNKI